MLRIFLLIPLLWLLPSLCYAQPEVQLTEVSVETIRVPISFDNLSDSIYTRRIVNESVGALLAKRSGLQLLQYGATGSAIMARNNGLASAHTSVNWNGMPLASRSLGVCDLSMLPAAFFDEIRFVPNSAQSRSLGTTMGGAVELNKRTLSSDKQGVQVMLGSSFNSMLNQSWLLKTSVRGKHLDWSNALLVEDNKNNFRYRDEYSAGRPWVNQLHNRSKQTAIYQQLSYAFANQKTKAVASGWWQWRHNQLPALMGISKSSNAEQRDSVIRGMLDFTHKLQHAELKATLAWIDEWQVYTDKWNASDTRYSIDSRVRIRQGIGTAQGQWQPTAAWNMRGAVNLIRVEIDNTNYAGGMVLNTYPSASAEAAYTGGVHKWTGQVRYEKRALLAPATAYGAVWNSEWMRRKTTRWNLDTELNAQRKFRNPDFNELYWVPGGNAQLRAERGYSGELTIAASRKSYAKPILQWKVSGFVQHIFDWIQWTPTQNGYWSPQNVKEVWSNGARTTADFMKSTSKFLWHAQAMYQYTHTSARFTNNTNDNPQQLPYVAPHEVLAMADVVHKSWDMGLSYRYFHARYTDQSNTTYLMLPSYGLLNASIGYRAKLKHVLADLQLQADNILNVQYQQVRSYAMPGRVISLSLKIQFNSRP